MNTQIKYWEKFWSNKDFAQIASIVFGGLLLCTFLIFLIKPKPEYALLLLNVGLFVVVLFTFGFYLKKKKVSWEEFGFAPISFKWFILSFLLIFFVIVVGGLLSKIWSNILGINGDSIMNLNLILSDKAWLNILNLKIGIAVLIPFAEELFFRGLVFKFIRQEKSFIFSALLSAMIFSAFHLSLASLPFTIILGLVTAFTYEKTKSILYPFLIHMGVNSIASNIILFGLI